jgi:predicted transposase YdaD
MRESVTHQAVLEEGRQEGREEGRRSIVINLLREGAAIELAARVSGMSIEAIHQLQASLSS